MKKIIALIIFIIVLALGAVFHKPLMDALPAFMTPIVSEVETTETLNPMIEEAKRSKVVKAGEIIENDSGLPMTIASKDLEGEVYLMPKSKVKLSTTKTQNSERVQFELMSGKIKVKKKKLGWKKKFKIKTPTTVAGVRGTIFSVEFKNETTTLRVPEGEVEFNEVGSSDIHRVAAGEKLSHQKTGFGKIKKMSREEIDREESSFWSADKLLNKENSYKEKLERTWKGSSRGFKLIDYESAYLDLASVKNVRSLAPLKGFPLTTLKIKNTEVMSLNFLSSMSIHHLDLTNTKVQNFKPLTSMPLSRLNLEGTSIQYLTGFENLSLSHLYLGGSEVKDLTPLKGQSLKLLTLWKTKVSDLDAIKGMPLEWLSISNTSIDDLSPLKGMDSLEALAMDQCKIKDLSPLQSLKLKKILLTPDLLPSGWESVIKSISTLEVIARTEQEFNSNQSPEAFWKKVQP